MKTKDFWCGLGEIAAASPLFLFAPLYRRRHLCWGATDAEVGAAMPGDELVPHPSFNTTRAITIDAPPDDVWPWLIQIGYGRAGFYSYDLFDNAGRPSADRIIPEHQQPAVGDWMPMAANVNETTAFKIKAFEPNRFLLWEKPHSTWAWKLELRDGGRTRLVTRLKDHYPWRAKPANALLSLILSEFGDFSMMRKLLLGVKRRAEKNPDAGEGKHRQRRQPPRARSCPKRRSPIDPRLVFPQCSLTDSRSRSGIGIRKTLWPAPVRPSRSSSIDFRPSS